MRENRTPGSVRGRPGNRASYLDYDPVTGRWPSRDPLGENWDTGEFNVYAFVLNCPTVAVDDTGLAVVFIEDPGSSESQPSTTSENGCLHSVSYPTLSRVNAEAKCTIILEMNHGGAFDPDRFLGQCERMGGIGCGHTTDIFNRALRLQGCGIEGLPRTHGTNVGPRRTNRNGDYWPGPHGFESFLGDAIRAAKWSGKELCEYPNCCEEVTVKIICPQSEQENRRVMGSLFESSCGWEAVIPCESLQ